MIRKSFRRAFIAATVGITLFGIIVPVSGQTRYGTGLDHTPEQLLEASRSATPPAELVASGGQIDLPPSLDLSSRFPPPGNQGSIGSCGGWAVAYAAKSFQEKSERDWDMENQMHRFSPSFLYNQVNGGRDSGSSFPDLFAILMTHGAASLATMPYTTDYRRQPDAAAFREAQQYPIRSFVRIPPGGNTAIKSMLVQGKAVVFGMEVDQSFMNYTGGIFRGGSGRTLGGHAMAIVGYDDSRRAYRIINSWSTRWGDGGYAWIDYDAFARLTHDVWALDDVLVNQPPAGPQPPADVSASMGSSPEFVEVSWSPVPDGSYRVYRANLETRSFEPLGTVDTAGFRDTQALPGVEYLYAVSTVASGSRESELSAVATGMRAEPDTTPGRPDNLTGVDTGTAIELSWDEVAGADYYDVFRMDPTRGAFMSAGASIDGFLADPGADEYRSREASVTYIVRATNTHGSGEFSYAVTVSFESSPDAPQPAPGGVPARPTPREKRTDDDRIIPKPQSRQVQVEREEYDLFDADQIFAYFREAYAAEREAFRKYREQETESFQNARSAEDDAFQQFLQSQRSN